MSETMDSPEETRESRVVKEFWIARDKDGTCLFDKEPQKEGLYNLWGGDKHNYLDISNPRRRAFFGLPNISNDTKKKIRITVEEI